MAEKSTIFFIFLQKSVPVFQKIDTIHIRGYLHLIRFIKIFEERGVSNGLISLCFDTKIIYKTIK